MNGPLKFLTVRKILPLLDLLAKFKRVLVCSCSPNFCVAWKLSKQIFHFCLCSQKNRSTRHARECSQRPFVTPKISLPQGQSYTERKYLLTDCKFGSTCNLYFSMPGTILTFFFKESPVIFFIFNIRNIQYCTTDLDINYELGLPVVHNHGQLAAPTFVLPPECQRQLRQRLKGP